MTDLQRYIDESVAAEQRDWMVKIAKKLKYGDRVTFIYDEGDDKIEMYTAKQNPDVDDPVAWLLLELGDDNDSEAGLYYLAERLGRVLYYAECPNCDYFVRDCVCAGAPEPLSAWEANNVSLGLNRDGSV